MINWPILTAWQNWALVLFVLILLTLFANIFSPFIGDMEN